MYGFYNMSTHCQLGRSLERILEEACLSGELKLSNRKLKEFPKCATKYDLSDTVYADLSRNKFTELPDEITSFVFLETLILYHNTIRTISETIKNLSCLTYLDLGSNQLSTLPREICFLPIHVLLIANNRLTSLPEELGRMRKLTELDASCNLLTNLPPRIGDLKDLKSLSLRSNQLIYLPRELTMLSLVSLNLSNNKLSSLPIELRLMTTLVDLNLENNPLTSPPASLCVRGLVHVFKFLEIQAIKDDNKTKLSSFYEGYSTLKRTSRNTNGTTDNNKSKTNIADLLMISNESDKLSSQEASNILSNNNTKPIQKSSSFFNPIVNGTVPIKSPKSQTIVETNQNLCNGKFDKSGILEYSQNANIEANSTLIFNDTLTIEDKLENKNKNIGSIQTYKEYKEALKQQRNMEIENLYRTKCQRTLIDETNNHISSNCSAIQQNEIDCEMENTTLHDKKLTICVKNNLSFDDNLTINKPVQKVTPSRHTSSISNISNAIQEISNIDVTKEDNQDDYVKYSKPKSPKCNNNTNLFKGNNTINNTLTKVITTAKVQPSKSQYKNLNWNQDASSGKLSFTMRREFDKHKEETELISQLRNIIETRLKMKVPEDVASALTDGVILCHLANYIRPSSIASIHVPSPGVQKLTMARCRRNVDNFLEACRKIGIDEKLICCAADILEGKSVVQIAITVVELFRIHNNGEINTTSPTRITKSTTISRPPPPPSSSLIT